MKEKLQALITRSEAAYEAAKNDSYLSHVYRAKTDELRRLALHLEEEGPEELLRRLRAELPELEEELAQELEHPTFDWYDEHYHAKVLEGVLDARRAVIELPEET